jgi:hypothetical protein
LGDETVRSLGIVEWKSVHDFWVTACEGLTRSDESKRYTEKGIEKCMDLVEMNERRRSEPVNKGTERRDLTVENCKGATDFPIIHEY